MHASILTSLCKREEPHEKENPKTKSICQNICTVPLTFTYSDRRCVKISTFFQNLKFRIQKKRVLIGGIWLKVDHFLSLPIGEHDRDRNSYKRKLETQSGKKSFQKYHFYQCYTSMFIGPTCPSCIVQWSVHLFKFMRIVLAAEELLSLKTAKNSIFEN